MLNKFANETIIAIRLAKSALFCDNYMEKFFQGENNLRTLIIRLIEQGIYRTCSIFESVESPTHHSSSIQIIKAMEVKINDYKARRLQVPTLRQDFLLEERV